MTSREALKLATTQSPATVYADDGIYAGLVWSDGRWSCGTCTDDGGGGRGGLLAHDAGHQQGDVA